MNFSRVAAAHRKCFSASWFSLSLGICVLLSARFHDCSLLQINCDATARAFCCAGILWSVSPNCRWVKLLKMSIYSVAGLYSFSPDCSWVAICRWVYIRQASIAENPVLGAVLHLKRLGNWSVFSTQWIIYIKNISPRQNKLPYFVIKK
jgi:hypothetical protein